MHYFITCHSLGGALYNFEWEKPEKVEKIPFFTDGIITLNPSESGLTSHK